MRLPSDQQGPEQLKTIRLWTSWWKAHRETLLDGELQVHELQAGASQVIARGAEESIVALYADRPVRLESKDAARLIEFVQGHTGDSRVVENAISQRREVVILDTQGRELHRSERNLGAGPSRLPVLPVVLNQLSRVVQ